MDMLHTMRLTPELWAHIIEEHCELAGMREEVLETISGPECVFHGRQEEYLAPWKLEGGKYLVVV